MTLIFGALEGLFLYTGACAALRRALQGRRGMPPPAAERMGPAMLCLHPWDRFDDSGLWSGDCCVSEVQRSARNIPMIQPRPECSALLLLIRIRRTRVKTSTAGSPCQGNKTKTTELPQCISQWNHLCQHKVLRPQSFAATSSSEPQPCRIMQPGRHTELQPAKRLASRMETEVWVVGVRT